MKLTRWKTGIFLLFLLLTGAGLRLIHIGTPSIWVDENITVSAAKGVIETGRPVMRVSTGSRLCPSHATRYQVITRGNAI